MLSPYTEEGVVGWGKRSSFCVREESSQGRGDGQSGVCTCLCMCVFNIHLNNGLDMQQVTCTFLSGCWVTVVMETDDKCQLVKLRILKGGEKVLFIRLLACKEGIK